MYVADITTIQEARDLQEMLLAEYPDKNHRSEQQQWDLDDIEERLTELESE